MSLNTSLKGRLRNTNLPKSNVLFPVFEAVVNSIHSIDERIKKDETFSISDSFINITLIRSSQLTTDTSFIPEIVGFEIIDNGIGFNNDNYNSFQTLDSEYKIDKGCRGVGRLLWLKVFKKASVVSTFIENSQTNTRSFDFDINNDIDNENITENVNSPIETSIKLLSITKEYEKHLPKTAQTIGFELLEHCLWYFLRNGGTPDIYILDSNEKISLLNEFESYMLNASEIDSFNIKSQIFEITHVKLKSNAQNKHSIIFSAADRVVKEEPLTGKIPGLFGILNDGNENFCYKCFVTSPYLTEKVTPERLGFNMSESIEGLFIDDEISFNEIRTEITSHIIKYLEEFLIENKQKGIAKVIDFIDTKAPRYRPILDRIPENEKFIDPSINDKDLELKLHGHLMKFESELLSEGHDLMKPTNIDNVEEYSKKLEEYLSKVSDLKKSDLANYVGHRKVILDLFGKAIEIRDNGKYSKEDVIHQLIMPMQKNSREIFSNDSNLWLIDERLAFHNFLASDKTIKSIPVTDSNSTKEPDLFALNVYDNPILVSEGQSLPLASITVIEIKRPMRNDATQGEEKDPIEQALGYLKRVRVGNVKTESGRQIPNSENIPGFCYVLCDITSTIKDRCDILDLQITSDKMGYFGYHKTFNTYIEVISFDRLLNMAKERNRGFFDKLGLPTT